MRRVGGMAGSRARTGQYIIHLDPAHYISTLVGQGRGSLAGVRPIETTTAYDSC